MGLRGEGFAAKLADFLGVDRELEKEGIHLASLPIKRGLIKRMIVAEILDSMFDSEGADTRKNSQRQIRLPPTRGEVMKEKMEGREEDFAAKLADFLGVDRELEKEGIHVASLPIKRGLIKRMIVAEILDSMFNSKGADTRKNNQRQISLPPTRGEVMKKKMEGREEDFAAKLADFLGVDRELEKEGIHLASLPIKRGLIKRMIVAEILDSMFNSKEADTHKNSQRQIFLPPKRGEVMKRMIIS